MRVLSAHLRPLATALTHSLALAIVAAGKEAVPIEPADRSAGSALSSSADYPAVMCWPLQQPVAGSFEAKSGMGIRCR